MKLKIINDDDDDNNNNNNDNDINILLTNFQKSPPKARKLKNDDHENININNNNEDNCIICLESKSNISTIICGHSFCFICILTWSEKCSSCPLCKKEFFYILNIKENKKYDVISTKLKIDDDDADLNYYYNDEFNNNNNNNNISNNHNSVCCRICNREGDDEKLLLCDRCNGILNNI